MIISCVWIKGELNKSADDSLIIMKATSESATRLQEILDVYEKQSGQKINRNKSSAFFSKKTCNHNKQQVLQVLGICTETQMSAILVYRYI